MTPNRKAQSRETEAEGFTGVSRLLEELEKDSHTGAARVREGSGVSGLDAVLELLGRAADEPKFLARLAENPHKVLEEYDMTLEQKAAIASGDLRRIESWLGKLDSRLSTWPRCRIQQEKW